MSVQTRSPMRFAGVNVHSGQVNTGEIPWTQGGQFNWGFYSGGLLSPGSGGFHTIPTGAPVRTQDQFLVYSGAGRLNKIQAFAGVSGVSITVYDAAVVGRSGFSLPAESGAKIIATYPGNTWCTVQGTLGGAGPVVYGVPFFSGLCVSAVSGTPGVVITFTPEATASGMQGNEPSA